MLRIKVWIVLKWKRRENKSNADGDVAWDAACSKGNAASEVANTGWGSSKSNTTLFGGGNGWSGGGSGG